MPLQPNNAQPRQVRQGHADSNASTFMTFSTHNGRLTARLEYQSADGNPQWVPPGACLLEQADESSVEIVWGTAGESSARLDISSVKAAVDEGILVLLD